MGIFKDAKNDIGGLRIAVPDDKKDQIVYKWPQDSIRRYSKAIVDADEIALFVSGGEVLGQLPPGQHTIDAQELPVVGVLIDRLFDGNAYRAELFFCRTTEVRGLTFGGRFADLREPDFGLLVEVRCYGDYAVKPFDAGLLVREVAGTVDRPDNDFITDYISHRLLRVMKEIVTRAILDKRYPVLGISAYSSEIEQATLTALNPELAQTGMTLVRFGDFDINIDDNSRDRLEAKTDKMADIGMAGDPRFGAYAQGRLMEGAAEGLSKGGGANQTAFMGMGMGLAGTVGQPMQAPQPPPGGYQAGPGGYPPAQPGPGGGTGGADTAAGGRGAVCPSCSTANAADARFCANCGTSLARPKVACPTCGTENPVGTKYCSNCGESTAPRPTTCAECKAELAPGAKFCPECGTPAAARPAAPTDTGQ